MQTRFYGGACRRKSGPRAGRKPVATARQDRPAGRVRLSVGQHTWEGRHGDLLVVPGSSHSLQALEDSAVLLTVAKLA